MSNDEETIPDNRLYRLVYFSATGLRLFADAIRLYVDKLESDLKAAREDPLIASLISDDQINQLQIARDISRFRRFLEILDKKIADAGGLGSHLSLYHEDVRLMKSVAHLYIDELRRRRDDIARCGQMSTLVLEAIDTQIAMLSEKTQGGIFENADPVPLLIDLSLETQSAANSPLNEKHVAARSGAPLPTPVYGIELLDRELRDRCLDLVEQFSSQPDRLDTIIAEATRVLEERIRRLSNADDNLSGMELVSFAFAGDAPPIRLADNHAEREASHLMFRGVFGFIRNPFHHRIIPINRERVVQLLGLIDYLLFLLDAACRVADESA